MPAALAAVIAERPLGYGAHGNDLEAFRLRGVRIGAMPVPEVAHPDTARLFADARTALAREGAVIIDLKSPSAFGELEEPESRHCSMSSKRQSTTISQRSINRRWA